MSGHDIDNEICSVNCCGIGYYAKEYLEITRIAVMSFS